MSIGAPCASPKPLLSSEAFSWLGITGIYSPFTGEANVNLAAVNGVTPLMAAAYGGHVDMVGLLLDKRDRKPVARLQLAVVKRRDTGDHAEQRGLSAAGGAEHREKACRRESVDHIVDAALAASVE